MEKEPKFKPREGLSEEERAMQGLLLEKYKEQKRNLLDEIKQWREDNLEATYGDSIRALYKELEEEI